MTGIDRDWWIIITFGGARWAIFLWLTLTLDLGSVPVLKCPHITAGIPWMILHMALVNPNHPGYCQCLPILIILCLMRQLAKINHFLFCWFWLSSVLVRLVGHDVVLLSFLFSFLFYFISFIYIYLLIKIKDRLHIQEKTLRQT